MKEHLNALLTYGLNKQIVTNLDQAKENLSKTYETSFDYQAVNQPIEVTLENLLNWANQKSLFEPNTIEERDSFEAYLFDLIMESPMEVKAHFSKLFKKDKEQAFDYLYTLSKDINYIKTKRLKENVTFLSDSKYGYLEITINLSKPEKDPKDIEKALKEKKVQTEGPRCVICKENERNYKNARSNLRIIPLELNHKLWHFQYSPYGYFNEHSIVLSDVHENMKISDETFINLLDFLDYMPSYFIGSNADLPIVGGSILNHDHYQAGRHSFPIEKASVRKTYKPFKEVSIEHLNWPLSTIRLTSLDKAQLLTVASSLLSLWQTYDNEALDIISSTNQAHNTITPIARKVGDLYQFDLILRNNRTTKDYPGGIFHPHEEKWHIKKENIGLIEAMGLAVLPARLKQSLKKALDYVNENVIDDSIMAHKAWLDQLKKTKKHYSLDELYQAVGYVFEAVLEDCGVFKLDEQGFDAIDSFIKQL
ncbi:MAG: UDP-glucose--hexose-1-phosphate uridylyltransferase [Paracholeplasma sp.]|nr:UDP-glucose--hexose-1-phosphate uridylyltransferase [Paracholeplasma sp.]MDY3195318.1 UDP-glucose--hexose-1-phosphate uridylyltransferase [Paracholeplasma sp.]